MKTILNNLIEQIEEGYFELVKLKMDEIVFYIAEEQLNYKKDKSILKEFGIWQEN